MTDWPVKTLGEACVIDWGNTDLTKKSYVANGKYLAVSAAGPDGRIEHAEHKAFTPVLSAIGARCGRMFLPEEDFTAIKNTITLTPKHGVSDGHFLFFLLESLTLPIRGAAQPFMAKGDIEKFEISLPPLEEQKRIVALLDAATARVTELTACYEQARTHANNLFASALRGVLESNPDWPVKTLGEVAKWGSGGTPQSGVAKYYGGDIPWCVIGDLTESDVWVTERSITEEGLLNSSAKIVDVGAVLIAMYGASIGRTGVVRTRMATNQAIAFAYANQEIVHSDFLLMFLQSQKQRFIDAGQGAAQPNISQLVLKEWPISLPPLGEQKRIVARLDSMRAKTSEMVAAYSAKLTTAKNLRQSILEAAFAGAL